MDQFQQNIVRHTATQWASNPDNYEHVERAAQAADGGSFLDPYFDPEEPPVWGPFSLFYKLIEPENFNRQFATEFWSCFTFDWPIDLKEEDEIVQIFCEAAREAVE